MKFQFKKAEESIILLVFIQDSSKTTGEGLGSLGHESSITGGYVKRGGTGVALAVDEDVATEGTYQAPSAAGKVRIGTPANMPTGFYELHFHNDLFTTADYVTIGLGGASDMAPLNLEIQLTDFDLNTAFTLSGILSTALAESYGEKGAERTLTQLLYELKALLTNFSILGTTLTSKKLDQSTTAKIYTLNDATNPTALKE